MLEVGRVTRLPHTALMDMAPHPCARVAVPLKRMDEARRIGIVAPSGVTSTGGIPTPDRNLLHHAHAMPTNAMQPASVPNPPWSSPPRARTMALRRGSPRTAHYSSRFRCVGPMRTSAQQSVPDASGRPTTRRGASEYHRAETRDRTGDLQIFGLTLSQLSYRGYDSEHIALRTGKTKIVLCDGCGRNRERLPRNLA